MSGARIGNNDLGDALNSRSILTDATKLELVASHIAALKGVVSAMHELWSVFPEIDDIATLQEPGHKPIIPMSLDEWDAEISGFQDHLDEHILKLRGGLLGLEAGTRVRGRWFNDPNWYEGILLDGPDGLGFDAEDEHGQSGWFSVRSAFAIEVVKDEKPVCSPQGHATG